MFGSSRKEVNHVKAHLIYMAAMLALVGGKAAGSLGFHDGLGI